MYILLSPVFIVLGFALSLFNLEYSGILIILVGALWDAHNTCLHVTLKKPLETNAYMYFEPHYG